MIRRSPCYECEHIEEDKTLFETCLRCEARLDYADAIDPNGVHLRRVSSPAPGRAAAMRDLDNGYPKNNCITCGRGIGFNSLTLKCERCRELELVGKTDSRCADCGKQIDPRSTRCSPCSRYALVRVPLTGRQKAEAVRRKMGGESIRSISVQMSVSYSVLWRFLDGLDELHAEGYIRQAAEVSA